jgi:hypothetical protein
MLHTITDDGSMIGYHCTNPECAYHNCANWEPHCTCEACDTLEYVIIPAEKLKETLRQAAPYADFSHVQDAIITKVNTSGRRQGQTMNIPTSHPGIEWTGEHIVGLPQCECGTRLFLKMHFTEKELDNPVNMRVPQKHPNDPNKITGFWTHPVPARHMQLATALEKQGNTYAPATSDAAPETPAA